MSFVKGTSLRSSIDTAQVRQILEQEDEIVEGPNIVGTSLDNARTATRKSPSSVDSGSDIEDDDESSAS